MDTHSQIEDKAAEWLARQDSGTWTEHDEARLQDWLSASTAHRVAYLRLKSTWDTAARLRVLRAGALAHACENSVPPPGEWRRSPFFGQTGAPRKHVRVLTERGAVFDDPAFSAAEAAVPSPEHRKVSRALAAAAAALVVAIAAGFGAYRFWFSDGDHYKTAIGGFASVPMADGSRITLNTDSEIRIAVTGTERRIHLKQGEAFFEVAPDESRPFVVHAGSKRVIAVGTKFSVQHLGEDVRVLVTEGKVRVESSERRGSAAPPETVALLTAGDIARTEGSAVIVQKAPPPQVEEFLSWRQGYLRFHETALADAVAEINRYNRRKIFIEDPELAAVKISGTFRPAQYEAFVRVLQEGFGIQARTEEDTITLTQGP